MQSIIILPLGSQEYHGELLPLDTDTLLAESFTRHAVKILEQKGVRVHVAKTEPIGMSEEHKDFPGTEYMTSDEYVPLIQKRLEAIAARQPEAFIVIMNGHGGNKGALSMIVPEFNYRHDQVKAFTVDIYSERMQAEAARLLGEFDDHAGSVEASLLAAEGIINQAPPHTNEAYVSGKLPSHDFYFFRTKQFHPLGVVKRTPEFVIDSRKGRLLRDFIVQEIADSIMYWFKILRVATAAEVRSSVTSHK